MKPHDRPPLPAEQRDLRVRCTHPNGGFIEFRRDEIEQSIPERFEQQVLRHPERLAVKTRDCALSYDALNRAANRVASAILSRCGEDPEPVALLFEPGVSFVVASLAALKAGKIPVSLESTFPRARLQYMVEQSQARILVTNGANLPLARELGVATTLDVDAIDGALPDTNPGLRISPDALAGIEYTSGSTGQAKGIAWNHRGVLHAVMRHTNLSRMCLHDRLVMFRAALRTYLYAILNGAAFFPVNLHREDPSRLADWLTQEKITVYRAAVSVFRSFAASLSVPQHFPHLRLVLLFGEPTYQPEVELFRKHFSDRCVLASSLGCNEFGDYAYCFLDKNSPLLGGVVPGGYAVDDAEVLLLDENERTVGADGIGEIAIRSRYNAVGYWKRPDLTETAFHPDPEGGAALIYRTGDLGRRRADGCLIHLGRKDSQIKIRGHRVEVAEVETALHELEGVKQAVVVGREDTPGDNRLVAYIVPTQAHALTVSHLRRSLVGKLPDYMVPSMFLTVETFPLTATGKVDRRALPAPDGTRPRLEQAFIPPRTAIEKTLAEIWCGLLGFKQIGIDDSFFDLGGNSLLATQIISRLRNAFHVEIPLRALFEAPTVAGLATVLNQYLSTRQSPDLIDKALTEIESLTEEQASQLFEKIQRDTQ